MPNRGSARTRFGSGTRVGSMTLPATAGQDEWPSPQKRGTESGLQAIRTLSPGNAGRVRESAAIKFAACRPHQEQAVHDQACEDDRMPAKVSTVPGLNPVDTPCPATKTRVSWIPARCPRGNAGEERRNGEADDDQDSSELDSRHGPFLRDQEERSHNDREDVGAEVRPGCPQACRVQGRQDQVGVKHAYADFAQGGAEP